MTTESIPLERFNTAADSLIVAMLEDLFCSRELAVRVVLARPFGSVEEAAEYADAALFRLPDEMVRDAVNAHPAIGGKVAPGSHSAKEQSQALASQAGSSAPHRSGEDQGAESTSDTLARIRQVSADYEQRFGYRYLVRAAGLSAADILADLTSRMGNDDVSEWLITRKNLASINDLRLHNAIADHQPAHPTPAHNPTHNPSQHSAPRTQEAAS